MDEESSATRDAGALARAAESAIVVRIPVPAAIERIRGIHDPSAAAGMAAHVTVLYPFLEPSRLDASVRGTLARIVAGRRPFEVVFATTGRFPGTLWLDPEPAEPFRELTRAMSAAFPGHPAYGGAFPNIIPHLTVAQVDDEGTLALIEKAVVPRLPIAASVAHVEVSSTELGGRWRSHWRLPLGGSITGR
jgi:2'-5' RNA ligase